MSHHLKVLADAGLIVWKCEKRAYYSLVPGARGDRRRPHWPGLDCRARPWCPAAVGIGAGRRPGLVGAELPAAAATPISTASTTNRAG